MMSLSTMDKIQTLMQESIGFPPTSEQLEALRVFVDFMSDVDNQTAMILRGSAGTGKTTLASGMVRIMVKMGVKVVLMAPTGRAAKVFSLNSGHAAFTIHRKIYRQKSLVGDFNLNDNLHKDTLFIVDEASMIANNGYADSVFGSGCLFDDLIHYVYNGQNCRLMLVGDQAQLPPVGEEESPALNGSCLRGYGLKVYEADLNEVLRQSQSSGILYNATRIRASVTGLPQIRFSGFADIQMVSGNELIETLASSYSEVGMDETMVVTRSNKRANIYNIGIRNTILEREEELTRGDMLMVVKNNYYWVEKEKLGISFIANGDRAVVQRVRNVRELYGFRFADVTLSLPDYDENELTVTLLLDTLMSEAPALTREQQDELFYQVMEDYSDIPSKIERMKRIKEDVYYNALQVKYAYAITCHKAQGGQWAHVYIDQGYMTDDMVRPDYIHWLYTAFTRATEKLFLVNWPSIQVLNNS